MYFHDFHVISKIFVNYAPNGVGVGPSTDFGWRLPIQGSNGSIGRGPGRPGEGGCAEVRGGCAEVVP